MSEAPYKDPLKLNQAVEHIFYEAHRLELAYRALLWPQGKPDDALAVALLRARALLDFFTKDRMDKRTRPDDILCTDFEFEQPVINIPDRGRIDKEVAHLTYDRCGKMQAGKEWTYPPVFEPILNASRAFFEHALVKYGDGIKYCDPSRGTSLRGDIEAWLKKPALCYMVNQPSVPPVVSGGRSLPVDADGVIVPSVVVHR